MNQNCSKTQKCSNFLTRIVVKPRYVVIFQPEVYQQFVDTLLVEKLLHFWLRILLHVWLKSYYISGFYYNSCSKVTTFLVLLHFWLFTTFLGLTPIVRIVLSRRFQRMVTTQNVAQIKENITEMVIVGIVICCSA